MQRRQQPRRHGLHLHVRRGLKSAVEHRPCHYILWCGRFFPLDRMHTYSKPLQFKELWFFPIPENISCHKLGGFRDSGRRVSVCMDTIVYKAPSPKPRLNRATVFNHTCDEWQQTVTTCVVAATEFSHEYLLCEISSTHLPSGVTHSHRYGGCAATACAMIRDNCHKPDATWPVSNFSSYKGRHRGRVPFR